MITAATDGSSLKSGPTGWAWYVDEDRWASGGQNHGTNQSAELMGVIMLLRHSRRLMDDLHIISDSEYVINSATLWIPGWKARGWITASKKPVANLALMQELDTLLIERAATGRVVTFEHVRGHRGHVLNEKADTLATQASAAYKDGSYLWEGPAFGLG